MTFSDHLSEWLELVVKGSVEQDTLDDYTWLKGRYLDDSLGETPLNQLGTVDIQGCYADLQGRGLSASVIHHCHTVISGSLKTAVLWRRLTHNSAKGVKLHMMSTTPCSLFSC